ncbi:MAG: N(5)-(carboxyethyl)ornithine synthase [Propionibacteriaceae bacterium]|nr:N(5)-(carboxyethyl)ornithine synthase [Propionibacteriaceae bacterium]
MNQLSIGVVGRSRKENEHRLPLHPAHLDRIPAELRAQVFLEHGYGRPFGPSDDDLAEYVGGFRTREELVAECDVVLLPKPVLDDISGLRDGQVLLGWPHCVQDAELTQLAIDKKLTLIAFEAMNHWNPDGSFSLHVFHRNNELAGYCSVLHSMQLTGTSGDFGRRLRAVVIGFGATARGAVTALTALGVRDVDVLTTRQIAAVAAPIPATRLVHLDTDPEGVNFAETEDGPQPLPDFLAGYDIIVNCVLQDTDAPVIFLTDADLPLLSPGTLVVDVSCDEGMAFSWARPTTFTEPVFTIGDGVTYYAVDHSPSHLWNSATWEISEALLPFLPSVLGGPEAWDADATIARAIEIREGVIQNPAILSFQARDPQHPHHPLAT